MARPPFNLVQRRGDKPWWTVLLVGGPPDMFRKLQKRLAARRALALKYHWEYHKPKQYNIVPKDVDFILLIKDMFGHSDEDMLKKAAKKANVPILATQSEWSMMGRALANHGIRDDNSKYDDIMLYLGTGYQHREAPAALPTPEPAFTPILPPALPPITPPPVEVMIAAPEQEGTLHIDVSHLPLAVLARAVRAKLRQEGFEGAHITVGSETVETY